MKQFEEILSKMAKPEVPELKHQDILKDAILKVKEKAVISWWWLSIPGYVIAALLMKSIFVPHTNLISNLHEVASGGKYLSIFIFFIVPVTVIITNIISMRKIYFLFGSPKPVNLLKIAWLNLLLIFTSVIIILIYSI